MADLVTSKIISQLNLKMSLIIRVFWWLATMVQVNLTDECDFCYCCKFCVSPRSANMNFVPLQNLSQGVRSTTY